jgi:tetratricopeptide (TPR) repeat protein
VAQHSKDAPADTLEQLQSLGDRLVGWVSANPALVLGTAAAILLVAASIGGVRAWRGSAADSASAALATIQREYLAAMGAEPGSIEAPEPANPETARQVRTDFVERFASFAKEHEGTPAQALAALEASQLYEDLGASDQALAVVQEAAAALPADSAIRGVALRRVASLAETAGDYEAAAQAHLAAADTPGYPLRYDALADAARCWAEAAKTDEALALYARLQSEAPEYQLPPHVRARLAELEAARGR